MDTIQLQLGEHSAIQSSLTAAAGYLSKYDPSRPSEFPETTIAESYAIETFSSLMNVVSCVDQLHIAVDMLSSHSRQSTNESIDRINHITFSIENYYLRITSAYDRCLRLVNVVFQLGLPEKECRNSTIIKNLYVKDTAVATALKELDKFTNSFRPHRNTVAHASTYKELDLNSFGSYCIAAKVDDKLEKYSSFYESRVNEYVDSKKEEFNKNIEELVTLVAPLFDNIQMHFECNLESYT